MLDVISSSWPEKPRIGANTSRPPSGATRFTAPLCLACLVTSPATPKLHGRFLRRTSADRRARQDLNLRTGSGEPPRSPAEPLCRRSPERHGLERCRHDPLPTQCGQRKFASPRRLQTIVSRYSHVADILVGRRLDDLITKPLTIRRECRQRHRGGCWRTSGAAKFRDCPLTDRNPACATRRRSRNHVVITCRRHLRK